MLDILKNKTELNAGFKIKNRGDCELLSELIFDKTRPNGARRKILDDTFLRNLGWRPSVDLQRGLQDYMEAYILRHH